MQIVLLGAAGNVAQRISREALSRGHTVRAVVRDAKTFTKYDDRLEVVEGDATDAASVARVAAGADAIVVAVSPRPGQNGRPASSLTNVANAVIDGAKQAGVQRVIVVGGAGSLEVAPGLQLVDSPGFPDAYKAEALAQRDALEVYRRKAGGLEWTYISPAAEIHAGERTGQFQTGHDQLLTNAKGDSTITFEDYAAALVDELEQRKHVGHRITVAHS
jgi:putative NADH-flavin reductase